MMSTFWSWYIIALTTTNIVGVVWLLIATARRRSGDTTADNATTGHVWDEDLTELNNPLPRWWFGLFILSVIFAIGYLVLYPGLGNFAGNLGWTSAAAAAKETSDANARLESLYAGFRQTPVAQLAHDPKAVKVGRNVFANNCAACHGSDARGATGYPNLVDSDWLYGGDPETVLTTVLGGRHGIMPPLAATLPDGGVDQVAHYVLSLSGHEHDSRLAALGKPRFEGICAACHGVTGTGNQAIGAPNLTDDIWLHGGGDLDAVRLAINNGRSGVMPAWEPVIGNDRARLAVAWVLAQGAVDAAADQVATLTPAAQP
ncbi:MAG: cytochrome-c oxidase, cbb3-type subunit III [Dokdonella sp.]|uniref:cytochrome-c oxidase, cbb3-type subunit III n=1 Tax=Dokdonella sp. TaxID=2291710 RepID=UPI0032641C12